MWMPRLIAAIAALLFCLTTADTTQAARMQTQRPCVDEPDPWCTSFGTSGGVPVIRRIRLNATTAGTAIITFHGSVACINFMAVKGSVQLVSQIVDNASTAPSETEASGLLHTATLPPDGAASFNLASTRIFNAPAAGVYDFYFKIRRVALTPNPGPTTCRVYNAAFTIEFRP
jgi:hypothetical protein